MTSAIEAITLFSPIWISSGIFAMRRANKGFDNLKENPLYGSANLVIAGGQTLKGVRAVKDLTIASDSSAKESIKALNNTIEGAAKSNKFLHGLGSVFNFVSSFINPLIVGAEILKVMGSDDKADAIVRGTFSLGLMFAFEKYAKQYMGMPYTEISLNGLRNTLPREALYHKNPFVEKQVNAMKDYCMTKKLFNKISLKSLPSVTKGMLFVAASICGYKIGSHIADMLIGKEKKSTDKSNTSFSQNNVACVQPA